MKFGLFSAQAAGFLSEAHSEEADHADPFYAHCKVHSDKTMIKHRKRNFNTLKLRMEQKKLEKVTNKEEKPTAEQLRITRKLTKHQSKYRSNKVLKTEPWGTIHIVYFFEWKFHEIFIQFQHRRCLVSWRQVRQPASDWCWRRNLWASIQPQWNFKKRKYASLSAASQELHANWILCVFFQMAALADVRKKWHIPPAFSVEFIGYYLDRISRVKNLKSSLERNVEINKKLIDEQQSLRDEYDKVSGRK